MRRSTSIPYGKWYDSARLLFSLYRWSDDDKAELYADRMEDEMERLRSADMMAKRFVDKYFPDIAVTICPPVDGYSSWEIRKLRWQKRDKMLEMLQQFWRERV